MPDIFEEAERATAAYEEDAIRAARRPWRSPARRLHIATTAGTN